MHRRSSRFLDFIIKGHVVFGTESNSKALQDRSNIESMHPECVVYVYCIIMYRVCQKNRMISQKKIKKGWVIGRARYLFKRRYESKVDSFIYRKHWQVAT